MLHSGAVDKHTVVLWWSDEDGVFVAQAPDLPGCMAHGRTREDALAEIQQAMAGWIEVARETGRPVPEPRSTSSGGVWVDF